VPLRAVVGDRVQKGRFTLQVRLCRAQAVSAPCAANQCCACVVIQGPVVESLRGLPSHRTEPPEARLASMKSSITEVVTVLIPIAPKKGSKWRFTDPRPTCTRHPHHVALLRHCLALHIAGVHQRTPRKLQGLGRDRRAVPRGEASERSASRQRSGSDTRRIGPLVQLARRTYRAWQ